ncbi:MAG TPA: VOC family protein, partial [Candidatus Acidoferrales bacterium]
MTFNHAMIYVRRIEPALRFYRDRLGFRLIETFRWQGRAVYARLRSPRGNTSIALHLPERGDRPNT